MIIDDFDVKLINMQYDRLGEKFIYESIDFNKPIVIIQGSIGVGKSLLASRLNDFNPEKQYLVIQTLRNVGASFYLKFLKNLKDNPESDYIVISSHRETLIQNYRNFNPKYNKGGKIEMKIINELIEAVDIQIYLDKNNNAFNEEMQKERILLLKNLKIELKYSKSFEDYLEKLEKNIKYAKEDYEYIKRFDENLPIKKDKILNEIKNKINFYKLWLRISTDKQFRSEMMLRV